VNFDLGFERFLKEAQGVVIFAALDVKITEVAEDVGGALLVADVPADFQRVVVVLEGQIHFAHAVIDGAHHLQAVGYAFFHAQAGFDGQ
jgi:hypothetical protein